MMQNHRLLGETPNFRLFFGSEVSVRIWSNNSIQIAFKYIEVILLTAIQRRFIEFLQVRQNKFVDI